MTISEVIQLAFVENVYSFWQFKVRESHPSPTSSQILILAPSWHVPHITFVKKKKSEIQFGDNCEII